MKPVDPARSLATLRPEIAAQWHPVKNELSVEQITSGSNKEVWWLCSKGHEYDATVSNRTGNNRGCPYCSGRKAITGETDLATLYPKIAQEWHFIRNEGLIPSEIASHSNKKVWWQCSQGHEWKAVISSRSRGHDCPCCSGNRVITGETDLETLYPQVALEWHPTKNEPVLPYEVTARSTKSAWWLCSEGHEWKSSIAARTKDRGHLCFFCTGLRATPDHNLSTWFPTIAREWHPAKNGSVTPDQITKHAKFEAWWQCDEGHEWKTYVSNRTNQGNNCPYCGGQRPIIGKTDLATTNPELASEWHPSLNGVLRPTDVMQSSRGKVWWLCKNGHEWETHPYVRSAGSNCPDCVSASTSRMEIELGDWLESMGLTIVRNSRRVISPLELDIFLPKFNLAIELNGLYWHSELFKTDPLYHQKKMLLCQEAGVNLLQIWEDDWRDRKEVVKKIISRRLGFYSSPPPIITEVSVRDVSSNIARKFFEENDLRPFMEGIHLGIQRRETEELISMVTLEIDGPITHILQHMSTCSPAAGLNVISNYVFNALNPSMLSAVVDETTLEGEVYASGGFTKGALSPPQRTYLHRNRRILESEKEILPEGANPLAIWDAGWTRWTLGRDSNNLVL